MGPASSPSRRTGWKPVLRDLDEAPIGWKSRRGLEIFNAREFVYAKKPNMRRAILVGMLALAFAAGCDQPEPESAVEDDAIVFVGDYHLAPICVKGPPGEPVIPLYDSITVTHVVSGQFKISRVRVLGSVKSAHCIHEFRWRPTPEQLRKIRAAEATECDLSIDGRELEILSTVERVIPKSIE